jgi:hypothetical protein
MVKGTIYNKVTGYVVMTCQVAEEKDVDLQCILDPNYAAYHGEEVDGDRFYFKEGVPTERQVMNLVFEPLKPVDQEIKLSPGQMLRVTGITDGSKLTAPGNVDIIVDDGFFEWETDVPGEYHFSISKGAEFTGVAFHAIVG